MIQAEFRGNPDELLALIEYLASLDLVDSSSRIYLNRQKDSGYLRAVIDLGQQLPPPPGGEESR